MTWSLRTLSQSSCDSLPTWVVPRSSSLSLGRRPLLTVSHCILRQCGHDREVSAFGFVSLTRSVAKGVARELANTVPTSYLYAVFDLASGSGRRLLS